MALLTFKQVSLAYGMTPLLDNAEFSLDKGERVALIGRNGEGKSTLMRVILNEQKPDGGEVIRHGGVRIAKLDQEVPQDLNGTVYDVVLSGAGAIADMLVRYHHCDPMSAEFSHLHEQIDANDGWTLESRVLREISRMEMDPEAEFSALSGGMKRRVLLARALVQEPDILLLDEPTNHLDLRSIEWLEQFFQNWNGTLLFITHDRRFLQKLATRILELDRGCLRSFPGDFQNYLRRREEILHAEQQANNLFDKKLAQEEVWIRQGIKARRTRNEGRVRELKALRVERSQRRELQGKVSLQIQGAEKSGRTVIEAKGLQHAFAGKCIVRNLDLLIERGDKIAILGDNGVGKTTLLRLLLQQLAPDAGTVQHGTKLEVAYFDQLRNKLDESQTVIDNVGEGADFLEINGQRKHVHSYLQDFLFSPARARTPISALSGGERNRLLLAKLFTKPCNVLIMDEPTNDLDVETLELLEELLIDYKGTLLLISHDRDFVDSVATSVLAFEGNGVINEYVGGYEDWLRQRPASVSAAMTERKTTAVTMPVIAASVAAPAAAPAPVSAKKKLSYKDQRELDALPALIEKLESEQSALSNSLADPEIYRKDAAKANALTLRMQALEAELATAYERWHLLDA